MGVFGKCNTFPLPVKLRICANCILICFWTKTCWLCHPVICDWVQQAYLSKCNAFAKKLAVFVLRQTSMVFGWDSIGAFPCSGFSLWGAFIITLRQVFPGSDFSFDTIYWLASHPGSVFEGSVWNFESTSEAWIHRASGPRQAGCTVTIKAPLDCCYLCCRCNYIPVSKMWQRI